MAASAEGPRHNRGCEVAATRPSRIVAPVALTLALALVGVRWWLRPAPAAMSDAAIGRPFPRLALAALPGTLPFTDATLRGGRATLVTLFASWCLPCRAEAPALAAARAQGIVTAGIAVRDAPAAAAAFLTATGIHFGAVGLDLHERVQPALASSGIPEAWLVDGDGIIRRHYRGALTADDVDRIRAMRLDTPMPIIVSVRMRLSSVPAIQRGTTERANVSPATLLDLL